MRRWFPFRDRLPAKLQQLVRVSPDDTVNSLGRDRYTVPNGRRDDPIKSLVAALAGQVVAQLIGFA
ncbi:hypothetical protein SAZ10_29430 [Mesorhizobium sp. BAC0120]|uniref:hypothetical protein n=1 Tax=Mesorhizobium sp. BAC0120 TaxID=3090670 RepID=UPI00298CBE86|nr:hypothetical protein [Mesorhizobium sp. BAC0120]MDW6025889.1 hypothetical protein [Mesorhizobium sp. BAC0120]